MNLELNGNKLLIVVVLLLLLSMFKYFNHTDNASLVGRKWILSAYNPPNEKIRKRLIGYYHLEFYDFFSIVKVDRNCSHRTEKYTIRDNKIDILYRTYNSLLMVCSDIIRSKQYMEESDFISYVMSSEFVYSIQDGRLVLTSPDGEQLLFSEAKKYQRLGFFNLLGIQLFFWLESLVMGLVMMPIVGSFLGFIYHSRYYILTGFAVYMYWSLSNKLFK